ncbi:MAG: ABC transporter permease [Solirubrobacteraceae bacterium]
MSGATQTSEGSQAPVEAEALQGSDHAAMTALLWRLRDYAIVGLVAVLFVVMSIEAKGFFSFVNFMNIVEANAPLILIALGTTFVIISGAFDLSSGQVLSLAGIVGANVAYSSSNPVLGVIVGICVGVPAGTANGLLVSYFKVNSFLATLATSLIFAGIALLISGGFSQDLSANTTFRWIGSHRFGEVPASVLIVVLVFIVLSAILTRSKLGRYIYAVGSNPEAARLSGISILKARTAAYAIGGLTAALGGMILTTRTGVGSVVSEADSYTLDAIAVVVVGGTSILGGRGALWRTAVGAALIALVNNALNLLNVQPYWQEIVTGGIIILAIIANASGRD